MLDDFIEQIAGRECCSHVLRFLDGLEEGSYRMGGALRLMVRTLGEILAVDSLHRKACRHFLRFLTNCRNVLPKLVDRRCGFAGVGESSGGIASGLENRMAPLAGFRIAICGNSGSAASSARVIAGD